ncbi:phosphoenolpyruvate--protein phosphotransferase [Thioalbus denitrificans]|uniref:phosphoenolpyruvate--protein phosphotransferase n=1 Tax=Thioalbus denitrificans TaxID=547122 RepID=A0A369BVB0_9GAMM|nr:phosphoenolpyruvate--protein phosphotransferase [Thioalbus denitrificans]RCX24935.1 phosphotransferase system enzyme I (PtsP) [Thioalbus denitrificans]
MLKTLRRIVQDVNAARNLGEALSIIVASVKAAMDTHVCSVYLVDPEHKDLRLMATDGLRQEAVGVVRLTFDQGLVGYVAQREEPVNLEDAPTHPRYLYFPETGEERYNSFLGVPIIHQRRVLGVLVVQQQERRRFDGGEVAFLITMSAQLAGVIAHALATGDIQELGRTGSSLTGNWYTGVAGAPGVGIGTAVVVYPPADLEAVPDRAAEDVEMEIQAFHQALEGAKAEIRQLSKQLSPSLPPEDQVLFDAFIQILGSDTLVGKTEAYIRAGSWAPAALRDAIRDHVRVFEGLEDEYLRERAADLKDIGRRILAHLQESEPRRDSWPQDTILVGEEISASELAEVPPERLAGIVSVHGSSSSHVAILARALGVPAVMGLQELKVARSEGLQVVVDGNQGRAILAPSATLLEEYQRLAREEKELQVGLTGLRHLLAQTPDGHHLPLFVNTGLLADITPSLNSGAEGIGLYRTEIPFMIRERFPDEDEQRVLYREVLERFAPRPVVMRTLDVGGDKALPYFPVVEDNPFLGWRGIRITLDHPEIFLVQVRAMLRASSGLGNLQILLPMISGVDEVDESLQLIHRAYAEVLEEEGPSIAMPRVGVMVEVPSAVYQIRALARRVDFLSVGSNDLTQYLLAVDRNNARVAGLFNTLHPGVLHALKQVVDGAHAEGKPVSICGEMAGDPVAAVILMGLGFDTLSMGVPSVPLVKWAIRNITLDRARELALEVLEFDNGKAVRAHVGALLEAEGLLNPLGLKS